MLVVGAGLVARMGVKDEAAIIVQVVLIHLLELA